MGSLLIIVLVMSPIVIFLAVGRNQVKRSTARSATVELDVGSLGVRRILADGREERIDWDELAEVEVLTAKGGPYGASGGVVILAGDEERGCLVPLDQIEGTELLEHLGRLPGFDLNLLVEGMQKPPATRTPCWTRPAGPGPTDAST